MIHRDSASYEKAIAEYRRAHAAYETELNAWKARIATFGESAVDTVVTGAGCISLVVGICVVVAAGVIAVNWGWLVLWIIVLGVYVQLSEWRRGSQLNRFVSSNPEPVFDVDEPTYRPPSDSGTPPPRQGRTPPPRRENTPPPRQKASRSLGLGEALQILGVASQSRSSVNRAIIKDAYRDRIREYHPDKVAHLGLELRELAETKSKQINAAYEVLLQYYNE